MSAEDLMSDADRKVRSAANFFTSIMGSGSSKLDDAAEMYTKAGNKFKIDHRWSEAANAYKRAAETHAASGNNHDVCQAYVEASQAIRKVDMEESVKYLQKSIDILTEMGRFSMAARHYQTLGDMFSDVIGQNPAENSVRAIRYFDKAADIYSTEDSQNSAQKCFLKIADLSAQFTKDYARAIAIYEQAATKSLASNLLKYGAKQHFFKAALCQLCVDHVNAEAAINRYCEQSSDFASSRECLLMKQLTEAVDKNSTEQFTDLVKEYDRMSRLDDISTELLARVKTGLEGEVEDLL